MENGILPSETLHLKESKDLKFVQNLSKKVKPPCHKNLIDLIRFIRLIRFYTWSEMFFTKVKNKIKVFEIARNYKALRYMYHFSLT